jgi:hypothetical protein
MLSSVISICLTARKCPSHHVLPEPNTCHVSFTAQERGPHTVNSFVEGKPLPPVEVLVLPKGEMLGAKPGYVLEEIGIRKNEVIVIY